MGAIAVFHDLAYLRLLTSRAELVESSKDEPAIAGIVQI
jgi:hypothetical protein